MKELYEHCVYTIALQRRLAAAADGKKFLDEGKPWVGAKKMLRQARKEGRDLAIVFSDSSDVSTLVAWSVLTRIRVDEEGTRYWIGPLWRMDAKTPQDLVRVQKHKAIAEGFIWPYALCETPRFLRRVAKSPRPWIYRESAPLQAREGKTRLSVHLRRERSVALAKQLKSAHMIRNSGHLPCQICGFDFLRAYGDVGEGFAEAHHIVPLALTTRSRKPTQLEDLIVVCANCHRMLHRGDQDAPSITTLRTHVRDSRRRRA